MGDMIYDRLIEELNEAERLLWVFIVEHYIEARKPLTVTPQMFEEEERLEAAVTGAREAIRRYWLAHRP